MTVNEIEFTKILHRIPALVQKIRMVEMQVNQLYSDLLKAIEEEEEDDKV